MIVFTIALVQQQLRLLRTSNNTVLRCSVLDYVTVVKLQTSLPLAVIKLVEYTHPAGNYPNNLFWEWLIV